MNWQPIETAPRDGTEILAWRRDCRIMLVRWDAPENLLSDSECEALGDSAGGYDWIYADFVQGDWLEGDMIPTHWMPLPDAPDTGTTLQNATEGMQAAETGQECCNAFTTL